MLYWIWLTHIKGIGPINQKNLLNKFTTPENIYNADIENLLECSGIGYSTAQKIISNKSLDNAHRISDNVKKLGLSILKLDDPLYPVNVKSIKESPILLYYCGSLIKESIGVAIAGSRRCSVYGKTVSAEAASYLAKNKICVISGMAKGIDSYAHTACLNNNGYTIAIVGCGLDICYPSEHRELMEMIKDKGAVISEYSPGVRPEAMNFPRRNLLISAWANKILVIEASDKSGSLITASYGKKYGRDIYAVPDNIYKKESSGSNMLILNGAKPYLSPQQLLIDNRYEEVEHKPEINNDSLDSDNYYQKRILMILKSKGTLSIEELCHFVKADRSDMLETLSLMELEDIIRINGIHITAN